MNELWSDRDESYAYPIREKDTASIVCGGGIHTRVAVEVNITMTRNLKSEWVEEELVMMRISDEECSGDSEVGVPVELDAVGGLTSEDSFMSRDPVLKKCILAQLSNSIAWRRI